MNLVDRQTLEEKKLEALKLYPAIKGHKWNDGRDGAYVDVPGLGTASIWLRPRAGEDYIRWIHASTGTLSLAPEDDDLLYRDPGYEVAQESEEQDLTTDLLPGETLDDYIQITPVGIVFLKEMIPFKVLEASFHSYSELYKAAPFNIGDLLNKMESVYGETYAQAMDITGRSYQTLAQWKWITKSIPIEERVPGVPITVYGICASLPKSDQAALIAGYAEGTLGNTDAVKEEKRKLLPPPPPPPPEPEPSAVDTQDPIIEPEHVEPLAEMEPPPCPLCGGTLGKTRCLKCAATVVHMAWRIHELTGELGGYFQEGVYGPLITKIKEAS